MTQDTSSNPSIESEKASEAAVTKQRKRRKWDQPADLSVSCSVPLITSGIFGISHPVPATHALHQNAVEMIQKINQPKVQDELIAREIVINDTEPNIRHKLTKRQTQDEIQKNTGAVVITRGKYQPQGSVSGGEKPLYLHISASSHLKDMAERIRAVDKAASMVEEIIKQGQALITQVVQPLATCVYLGFDADPSLNVANRIRGPNDQYINHIMNETGATVILRGRNSGSGYADSCHSEESLQPLHLYISSTNPKSLEAARILAENLLETIAFECGASRIQSSKTYSAIPPPTPPISVPLVPPVPAVPPIPNSVPILSSPPVVTPYPIPPVMTSGTHYSGYYEGIYPQATPLQQVALALKQASPAGVTEISTGVTASPAGVTASPAGITASTAGITASTAGITATQAGPTTIMSSSLLVADKNGNGSNKRSIQKRKFQELPVTVLKDSTLENQNLRQESEFCKTSSEELSDSNSRKSNLNMMPPPKKLVELGANGNAPPVSDPITPPPPPKSLMPPPPPKFNSVESPPKFKKKNLLSSNSDTKSKLQTEPAAFDTLLKLVEYGEEEDEDDESDKVENLVRSNTTRSSGLKPFWAV